MSMVSSVFKSGVAFAAIGLLCFPGCLILSIGEKGSGVSKTEQRETEAFDGVELSGAADIKIQCGEETSVSLTLDDNLLEMITTEVVNGTLEIGKTGNYSSSLGLDIDISTPKLNELELSGACDVEVVDCNTDELTLEVSGACDLKISGTVDSVKLELSGAGDVDLTELVARSVSVELSGAASASVNATEELDVEISGVGSVTYKGDPEVTKSISGLGSVDKISD